jgi:hypothetical protein
MKKVLHSAGNAVELDISKLNAPISSKNRQVNNPRCLNQQIEEVSIEVQSIAIIQEETETLNITILTPESPTQIPSNPTRRNLNLTKLKKYGRRKNDLKTVLNIQVKLIQPNRNLYLPELIQYSIFEKYLILRIN